MTQKPRSYLFTDPEEITMDSLNETGFIHNAQFITQPGSSVATSLSSEEAGDKKVALLKVVEVIRSVLKSVCTAGAKAKIRADTDHTANDETISLAGAGARGDRRAVADGSNQQGHSHMGGLFSCPF